MSLIDGIAATGRVAAPQSAASSAAVDYDTFLQLLVTQMKAQDPTKPMDSTEYVAQLANFSNVEQAIMTNTKLEAVLSATMLSTASNLVGRSITGADGQSGQVAQIRVIAGSPIAVLGDGREVAINGDWTLEG